MEVFGCSRCCLVVEVVAVVVVLIAEVVVVVVLVVVTGSSGGRRDETVQSSGNTHGITRNIAGVYDGIDSLQQCYRSTPST